MDREQIKMAILEQEHTFRQQVKQSTHVYISDTNTSLNNPMYAYIARQIEKLSRTCNISHTFIFPNAWTNDEESLD